MGKIKCPECDNGFVTCSRCDGLGVTRDMLAATLFGEDWKTCGTCDGEKQTPCKRCSGSGEIRE